MRWLKSLSHLIVHAVFSTKRSAALLRSEEIRSETYSYMAGILKNLQCHPIKIGGADDHVQSSLSSRFRRTLSLGIVTDPRPPFQGDSSRGRLPRAEAHGLFCFRPSGDPKCPNLQAAGSNTRPN